MVKFDDWDNNNNTDPVTVTLDLDEFCAGVVRMNYGVERLLAALVRALRNSCRKRHNGYAATIQQMVETSHSGG